MNKHPLIRKIYLYLFSLIGLVLVVIGCVKLVNLGLKAYVFTKADQIYQYPMMAPVAPDGKTPAIAQPSQSDVDAYQNKQVASQRERDAADSLAMIIVGIPLYLYHWGVIKKDKEND
jgi:hypothetical protein